VSAVPSCANSTRNRPCYAARRGRPPNYAVLMSTPAAANPPAPIEINDVGRMRALAHPARLAIMEFLGRGRPATATECAEICRLSPSATSYHLRALARAGLVEEAPSRGDARERLWQTIGGHMHFEGGKTDDPVQRDAEVSLIGAFLAWQDARARQFLTDMYDMPEAWRDAGSITENDLYVTPDELNDLTKRIQEILHGYEREHRPEPPDGARRVSFIIRALPGEENSADRPPGLAIRTD
jgi:DNA-binding transcriptional ArsR family regulator